MLLADLGADVIKIEPPGGDIARRVGPHSVGPHNVYFASLNRNKRSVCIDLSTPRGQHQLGTLVATAHALITNLRPAVIKKLGLTYDALRQWNQHLVCVALTGFGLDGPAVDRPAYDYVIQALTGVMYLTGDPGAPPMKTGYSAVDNSAGIMAALGLLAKIIEGKGGQVDISLYDVMLSQLNYVAGAYLNASEPPQRYRSGAHPYFVPAQIFQTRDGYLALFITHDDFWRRFATEVGRPAWVTDARFATMTARLANRDVVVDAVAALLLTDGTSSWVERLRRHGIVVAPVQTLEDALSSDLTRARDMIVSIDTSCGPLRAVGNPIKVPGRKAHFTAPPLLGEHTGECLRDTAS
jgi:crotonobetainyl-CoA:carnitine CoA-transferase CaiB-like acyl-CoA transferase